MKTKYWLYTLCCFILVIEFTSCIKQKCTRYILFEGQVNIYPKLDTFYVGDTFEIEVFFDQPLVDLNSGKAFYVESLDYLTALNFARIDVNPGEFAALHFIPSVMTGDIYYRHLAPTSHIGGEPGSYMIQYEDGQFKCRFKLMQAGNYYLYVMSELNRYHVTDLTDNCKDYLEIQYKMLNGDADENNYHLFQLSPNESYREITKEQYVDKIAHYSFVILE